MLPYEKVKLVIVGNSGVGKTTVINNLLQRSTSIPTPTAKDNVVVYKQDILTIPVKFQLWDTTGNTVSLQHLKGADGCILIHNSTESLKMYTAKWIPLIQKYSDSPIFVFHSHTDKITQEEYTNMTKDYNDSYIRMGTMYKDCNIDLVFNTLYSYIKSSRGF